MGLCGRCWAVAMCAEDGRNPFVLRHGEDAIECRQLDDHLGAAWPINFDARQGGSVPKSEVHARIIRRKIAASAQRATAPTPAAPDEINGRSHSVARTPL